MTPDKQKPTIFPIRICFDRFEQDQLIIDPEDGKKWNLCLTCEKKEKTNEINDTKHK